jgi:hypothetical protein
MSLGAPLSRTVLYSTLKKLQFNNAFSVGMQKNAVELSNKFGGWMNNIMILLLILAGIYLLYFVSAYIIYLWQAKQSVLKLLRRREE